jgi:uncharacterized protein DUF5670
MPREATEIADAWACVVHSSATSLGAAAARPRRWDIRITGKEDESMDLLWIIAVVFFVLWMLGFAAFHVTSGFIHILLVLALVAVVFRLVTGRRTV